MYNLSPEIQSFKKELEDIQKYFPSFAYMRNEMGGCESWDDFCYIQLEKADEHIKKVEKYLEEIKTDEYPVTQYLFYKMEKEEIQSKFMKFINKRIKKINDFRNKILNKNQ